MKTKTIITLIIGFAVIAATSITAKEESEKSCSLQEPTKAESWPPVEGAKKVGSGLLIEWEVPEDGTLFYAESTRKICFVTKTVKQGDIYKTFNEDGPDEQLAEVITGSIPGVNKEEVLSSLRFDLFFLRSEE